MNSRQVTPQVGVGAHLCLLWVCEWDDSVGDRRATVVLAALNGLVQVVVGVVDAASDNSGMWEGAVGGDCWGARRWTVLRFAPGVEKAEEGIKKLDI